MSSTAQASETTATWVGQEELEASLKHLLAKHMPSMNRIKEVTAVAMKHRKYYKNIVRHIEKYAKKCHPEDKISMLYVIDYICRSSLDKIGGNEKLQFTTRFSTNLRDIIKSIMECPAKDFPNVRRVVNLWVEKEIFSFDVLVPIIADVDEKEGNIVGDRSATIQQPSPYLSLGVKTAKELLEVQGSKQAVQSPQRGPSSQAPMSSPSPSKMTSHSFESSVQIPGLDSDQPITTSIPSYQAPPRKSTPYQARSNENYYDYGSDEDNETRIQEQMRRRQEEENRLHQKNVKLGTENSSAPPQPTSYPAPNTSAHYVTPTHQQQAYGYAFPPQQAYQSSPLQTIAATRSHVPPPLPPPPPPPVPSTQPRSHPPPIPPPPPPVPSSSTRRSNWDK